MTHVTEQQARAIHLIAEDCAHWRAKRDHYRHLAQRARDAERRSSYHELADLAERNLRRAPQRIHRLTSGSSHSVYCVSEAAA